MCSSHRASVDSGAVVAQQFLRHRQRRRPPRHLPAVPRRQEPRRSRVIPRRSRSSSPGGPASSPGGPSLTAPGVSVFSNMASSGINTYLFDSKTLDPAEICTQTMLTVCTCIFRRNTHRALQELPISQRSTCHDFLFPPTCSTRPPPTHFPRRPPCELDAVLLPVALYSNSHRVVRYQFPGAQSLICQRVGRPLVREPIGDRLPLIPLPQPHRRRGVFPPFPNTQLRVSQIYRVCGEYNRGMECPWERNSLALPPLPFPPNS